MNAFIEMSNHMAPLSAFYAPRGDTSPGMIGSEVRGILFAPHLNAKTIAEKYYGRQVPGI